MPFERINIPKQVKEKVSEPAPEEALSEEQEQPRVYHESDSLPSLESVLNPPKPYVGRRVREVEQPVAPPSVEEPDPQEKAEAELPGLPEHNDSGEEWKHSLGLPAEDNLQRDWSRYNRKLAFMYPQVVLPAWKRKR